MVQAHDARRELTLEVTSKRAIVLGGTFVGVSVFVPDDLGVQLPDEESALRFVIEELQRRIPS